MVFFPDVKIDILLDLHNIIHMESIRDVYPYIEVSLWTYLTLPDASYRERSFSKLKLMKKYLQLTIEPETSLWEDRL